MGQMQAHLWVLAARTSALPLGRGALTLATSRLLLTEPVPIPRLNLSGRVPQQNNATISLDMGTERAAEVLLLRDFYWGCFTPCSLLLAHF
jgi:anaphase-promoting complex subunit 1